ncbi:MAG: 5-(carboxyamino)imidazole ribonucleotide mutase [Candidatus Methanofishera endochildressiae]|uniref:N5-carboxyaminoimidazole ribonucleotide mutase n=1 Tax=Candidatus Methanofishera endochildressiae TaxID=2738884 RepID=A0A7Z0MNZ4_9GAMM|nr:5-(carboxyamino)imidazole ribonucleotide mutase [Candidatus Methanofishera endochildressiae]
MTALVGIIMGSTSDWETMRFASEKLEQLGIPFEVEVVSAHRTPDKLFNYAESAEGKGLEVIIAGAGGAAHLPGMTAAKTAIPVLGVPIQSKALNGIDSLLSIAQMPAGIPVGSLPKNRWRNKIPALLPLQSFCQQAYLNTNPKICLPPTADRNRARKLRPSGACF